MSRLPRTQNSVAVLFGIEWPTMLIWLLCWTFYFLLVAYHDAIHPLVFVLLASLTATWHSSFQHEAIHGHPTQSERLNRLLASPSMALWLPFEDYRVSHLTHHINDDLTHPDRDPESFYVWQAAWDRFGGWRRWLMRRSNTLLGRMTIGATIMMISNIVSCAGLMLQGNLRMWRIMLNHCAFSLPPTAIALVIFELPTWQYLVGFQFGAAFWLSLRSFLEHEAATGVGRRTAMVFDPVLPPTSWFTGFFSLLFLNNNLHAAHHLVPRLAWYQLPKFVYQNKDKIIAWNEGNQFASYGEVAKKFAIKAKEPVVHPNGSINPEQDTESLSSLDAGIRDKRDGNDVVRKRFQSTTRT